MQSAVAGSGFDMANLPALIQAAAVNSAPAYAKVPGITTQIIATAQYAVKRAYIQAFQVVYYTALGFACLAIISALCIKDIDPAKKTYEKAVHLENERLKIVSGDGGKGEV